MKTIITSSENNIKASFDKRFGRAAWFCLYDQESGKIEFIENENLNASNGAGTKAAERVVELSVQKVISGDFGPKAKDLLEKFNVQMVIIQDDDQTVENIIQKLNN
jgi:predicted Fe-Mo cluster-binding NifX family protein